MAEKYDVLVVGCGNAGIAAALTLAMENKKVLIVEKNNVPGGCATSFVRGRFEFDPSLHELCGASDENGGGNVARLFSEAGIKCDWVRIPDCFRVISRYSDQGVMDATMPSGRKAFTDAMEGYVPGSRKKMDLLFDLMENVIEGIAAISSGERSVRVLMGKYGNMIRTGSYSVSRVFEAMDIPQRCRDILYTYWMYLGVDAEHLSFIHYATLLYTYIVGGSCIPAHTSHQMSVALTEKFRSLGGEIWYNCTTESFLFKDGRCCGARTTMGDVYAGAVLANLNPSTVYTSMVNEDIVPERIRKLLSARSGRFSGRMLCAYFGLDVSCEELGIKDYCIFMSDTSDPSEQAEQMNGCIRENNIAIMVCPNVVNSQASPEGTCIISFTTFASAEEWSTLKGSEYFRMKSYVAEKFISLLKEKTGIDISGHVEEVEVATPVTFARYIGTPEGSVYGYETGDWDNVLARSMASEKDKGIDGLWTIGASGSGGDGYSPAYGSGMTAARQVSVYLERIGGVING